MGNCQKDIGSDTGLAETRADRGGCLPRTALPVLEATGQDLAAAVALYEQNIDLSGAVLGLLCRVAHHALE